MSDDQNSIKSPNFSNGGRCRGRGRGNKTRHQNDRRNVSRSIYSTIHKASSAQSSPDKVRPVIPTSTFVPSRIYSDPTPPSKLPLSSLRISNDKHIQQTSNTSTSSVHKNTFSSRNQSQRFRINNPVLQTKDLIRELVSFKGFCTDIETLSRNCAIDVIEVKSSINKYKGIFSTTLENSNKLLVKLKPKIKFCSKYIELTGCHEEICRYIHTCQDNLFNSCSKKVCLLGHNLNTNHNNIIFKDFYLEYLSTSSLKDILRQIIQRPMYPRVCFSYQNEFCEAGQSCKHLHICYQLVLSLGTCPNINNCSLNHNIHDPCCITIFNRFNIPTNESPRDLLKLLVNKLGKTGSETKQWRRESKSTNQDKYDSDWSNCSSEVNSVNSSRNSFKTSTASKFKGRGRGGYRKKEQLKDYKLEKDNCETNQLYCDAISIAKTSTSNANLSKNQKGNEILSAKSFPVCDWKIEGDVESPYICIPNLHGKCEDKKTVCKYLHSKRTYQWQFGDKNWFNFHAFHAEIIERHFRDASCDEVTLPVINPNLCTSMKEMPRILGTSPLKIDFTKMTLSGDYLKETFLIRHLTTTSTAINNDKFSTIFNWFFKNDEDKWQLYETNDNCEVSSDHIEKAYLSDSNVFHFTGEKITYRLDFYFMIQINESTRKIRAIRRRPTAIPYNESLLGDKSSPPNNWDSANASKGYSLISLNETQSEYKEVRTLVNMTSFCKIVEIFRIQNELLWRQFDNKKNELKAKYPLQTLKVQKLFHSVDDQYFEEICKENLDFRIHNESADKKFGQGAYFFQSASTANNFCKPDSGIKKLLVFDVIIGQTVKGDPSLTRPPDNNVYNALYDTTVDDDSWSTTFVKYNKHEYYPSYAVVYK